MKILNNPASRSNSFVYGSLILLFSLLLSADPVISFSVQKHEKLPEKYQNFLDLTEYIMLPQERDVFFKLSTDRERDVFMDIFWKQRDPTPGTPENEYREKHKQLFEEATRKYGYGTSRPGWMTDMGRIYIILGPPASIERFEATHGLYPAQVWYYYGDSRKGLPGHFGLIFFQRDAAGEYKLYDPVSDGPASLMVETRHADPTEFRSIYQSLHEIAPTLAPISVSLIVGYTPVDFQPTPENTILLAEIYESPKKDINPTYATHFLNYKGMVSTEYLTDYIANETQISTITDPVTGMNFVHFTFAPQHLTVNYYEPKDQYYCNFNLDVSLRQGESVIHQYSKEFPIYFDPENYRFITRSGITLEDMFPVAQGHYDLTILVRNLVGKEFSVFESPLFVFPENEAGIESLCFGYDLQDFKSDAHYPFKIRDKKLIVDPKNTFGKLENIYFVTTLRNVTPELWESGRLEAEVAAIGKEAEEKKTFSIPLSRFPFHNTIEISQMIQGGELSPDYYEMHCSLINENKEEMDRRKMPFIVSPSDNIAHPVAHAKGTKNSDQYVFMYMLADQYARMEKHTRALEYFEKAYKLNPGYRQGLVKFANFLFARNDFQRILDLVEPLAGTSDSEFEYYLLKGKALMGMGRYTQAIESLQAGNEIYNSDIGLLNSLGICYYRTGRFNQALEALNSSIRMDPDQPETRKLIEQIEKNK